MDDLDNTKYYNIINNDSREVVATGKYEGLFMKKGRSFFTFTDLKIKEDKTKSRMFDITKYDFEPLSSSGGRRRSRKHTKSRSRCRSTNRRSTRRHH